MRSPTSKQLDIYRFITSYQIMHDGTSPTIREMREFFGHTSDNGIMKQLVSMAVKGLVRLDGSRHRGIGITLAAKRILAEKWLNIDASLYTSDTERTLAHSPE